MSKPLYKSIETLISKREAIGIKYLIQRWGVRIDVFRQKKDRFTDVYGQEAGGHEEDKAFTFTGLVVGDEFAATDNVFDGAFNESFLYTNTRKELYVGDMLDVRRRDDKVYRFMIESKESIGMTDDVLVRYKLTVPGM